MVDPISIAGVAISGIGLLANLVKKYKDFQTWKEKDLPGGPQWLAAAIEHGKMEGQKSDYAWPLYNRVATLEMEGTHEQVAAYDEKKRLRYRIVRGSPTNYHVLMKKIS